MSHLESIHCKKSCPSTLTCRAQAVHPSLRPGRRPGCLFEARKRRGTSADASGRQQEGMQKKIFSTASSLLALRFWY